MKPTLLGSMLVVLLLPLLSRGAAAQEGVRAFGNKGVVAISAERIFGFDRSAITTSATMGGNETTQKATSFSFFGSPITGAVSPFAMPRLAFDGFIADRVSLGGSATYFSTTLSSSSSTNSTDLTGFLVAPRVGFAGQLSPAAFIWPRLGIAYVSLDSGTTTSSMLAVAFDAPITFVVRQNVLLMVGPTVEYGLTGKRESSAVGGASVDWKGYSFGLQCALGGSF